VRIHLANSGGGRGGGFNELTLLIEEKHFSELLSYENRFRALSFFERHWDELVKLHLATTSHEVFNGKGIREMLPENNIDSSLASYAYLDDRHEKEWSGAWQAPDLRPRVIIDSGAFTAWTSGKPIDPRDYARWALDFRDRWEHKMQALYFMNLDVIGDQDASWVNQSILEGLGLKPIPIVTFGADKKHLIRALDNYNYIALGGLVPYTRQKEKLLKWLDYCFAIIIQKYKTTGVMPKIHLLGVTTDWVLKRYPCFSSDSSSWVSCLRFGGGEAAGLKQIPRYKESDGAMSATIHTLRSEIRKYKKMEQEATNLWTKRGIIFNE
jgi:hypothetical protein